MASAARRARSAARRPFAVLASPSPARNGGAIASAENVVAAAPEAVPFALRVRRFGKAATKKCGGGAGLLSPVSVSKKPASRRRMMGPLSTTMASATPASAMAPRVPELSSSAEEDRGGEAVVRANADLSSISDEVDQGRRRERPRGGEAAASRKRAMEEAASRKRLIEEAVAGIPEPGEGRVKYLVDTFERLLSLSMAGSPEARSGSGKGRRTKSETAKAPMVARTSSSSSASSLRTPPPPAAAEVIDVSYPSSEVSFPAIAGVACILDASDRTSMTRAAREQHRQRRHNSTGSAQKTCSRKVTTVTRQRPFNLRTAQRGKAKEEDFVQRMRKMQLEEEMMRNPLAQGLPFTTDEPEYPVKPPIKEPTEPIYLVLHSDVRAVGRAKFDHQVAERTSFMEEVKLAKERQQKMDEEIEIKHLRKEQVPRAHPMPDFTKPFVPKRSVKPHTIPREPKFHTRSRKNVLKT
ncbi:hypothetical protein QOZ80_5AG0395150 [Eleusine coracana subsp. coracana]|nr:hypothetical protein QOZ80_5AG0395150 [Eleusine coracana subsp. coracana]